MYKPLQTIKRWKDYFTPVQLTHSNEGNFEQVMKNELFGRRIVKVQDDGDRECYLYLDNGRRLRLLGNEGCGGCGNGWYYVDKVMDVIDLEDNAITNVQLEVDYDKDRWCDVYRLFVITANKQIEAASFAGSDNGYYGTGFGVFVEVDDEYGSEQ